MQGLREPGESGLARTGLRTSFLLSSFLGVYVKENNCNSGLVMFINKATQYCRSFEVLANCHN